MIRVYYFTDVSTQDVALVAMGKVLTIDGQYLVLDGVRIAIAGVSRIVAF